MGMGVEYYFHRTSDVTISDAQLVQKHKMLLESGLAVM
jgi:hypothetical protein